MAETTLLCIGGPYNGEFVSMPDHYDVFEVLKPLPLQPFSFDLHEPVQSIKVEKVCYKRQHWHVGPEQPRSEVWVEEGLTLADVWHLLIQGYAELRSLQDAMRKYKAPTPAGWEHVHG